MYIHKKDDSSIGLKCFAEDEESECLLTVAMTWPEGLEFEGELCLMS